MGEAWRLALVALPLPADDEAEDAARARRQGQARHARERRAAALAVRRAAPEPPTRTAAQSCALLVPGTGALLGVRAPTMQQALSHHMGALVRLAVSPRLKGSGPAVESARNLQNVSVALVARTILGRQRLGLGRWLDAAAAQQAERQDFECLRGFTGMWDEASQRARSLSSTLRSDAPKDVQVMVMLAALFSVLVDGASREVWQWQPWVCAPLFLAETKHKFLLHGLSTAFPFNMMDVESMRTFSQGAFATIICLGFDFATSNVAAYGHLVSHCESFNIPGLMLHGERCLTHQLHIVKSACLSLVSLTPMLYSLSRIVSRDASCSGLESAIRKKVRASFVVRWRRGGAPAQDELYNMITGVFGMDGDSSLLRRGDARRRKNLEADLRVMTEKCHYDPHTQKWVYYVTQWRDTQRQRIDEDKVVSSIVGPLLAVLTRRRWEVATLSRWTGVLSCLKRMVLGTLMGNILPSALSGLSADMNITEAKVKKYQEAAQEAMLRGEDSRAFHNAKEGSRVLRVSSFFQSPDRSWQLGVILISASVVDRLAWAVIGAPSRGIEKLSLSGIADPRFSAVAATIGRLFKLLGTWSLEEQGQWRLLWWLRAQQADLATVMTFARSTVLQIYCALWLKAECRFACWPYRLQHLISTGIPEDVKAQTIQAFLEAEPCCLSAFGRSFRTRFPTAEDLRSDRCRRALLLWQSLLKFSTSPVECEHKLVKDDVYSSTTGISHGPIAHRMVCRHTQAAHLQKGRVDVSLPLRRQPAQHPGTGPCLGRLPGADLLALTEDGEAAAAGPVVPDPEPAMLDQIGGGNPKVMFINFRLAQRRRAVGASLPVAEVKTLRESAVKDYDESADLRARWRVLFDVKRGRLRVAQQRGQAANAAAVADPAAGQGDDAAAAEPECEAVWPAVLQSPGSAVRAPVADNVLAEYRSEHASSSSALVALARDATPFTVESVPDVANVTAKNMWGCGCNLHNVCAVGLSAKGILRSHEQLRAAVSKYVDSLGKVVAKSACHLMRISHEAANKSWHTWVLLGLPVFSPKVQVFIRAAKVDQLAAGDGFSNTAGEPPYELQLQSEPSRLCFGIADPIMGLAIETSDELCERLCNVSGGPWVLTPLQHKIKQDRGSLLRLVVDGHGEPRQLDAPAAGPSKSVNEALVLLQRLGRPRPMARPAQPAAAEPGPDGGAPLDDAVAEAAAEEDGSSSLGVGAFAVLQDVAFGSDALDLEVLAELAEALGAGQEEEEAAAVEAEIDDVDDESVLGGPSAIEAAPEPSAPTASASDDAEAVADAADAGVVAVIDQAAAVLAGAVAGEASSSNAPASSSGHSNHEVRETSGDGSLTISTFGYVRSSLPRFQGVLTLGLICNYRDGNTVCASCHLHPRCAIKVSVRHNPVEHMRLARWLALGEPCAAQTREQRLAIGAQHRSLWSRDGPRPELQEP